MSRKLPPDFLFEAIRALTRWLRSSKVPHVIVGGVAASILGRPRLTQDVDALVVIEDSLWESLLSSGRKFGIHPRISNAIPFAHKSRVLLVKHAPTSTDIDVMLGLSPFEENLIQHGITVRVATTSIRLPRPEDLVLMKIIAGRPKDLEDIRHILDAHSRINVSKLRAMVKELGEAIANDHMLKSKRITAWIFCSYDILLFDIVGAAKPDTGSFQRAIVHEKLIGIHSHTHPGPTPQHFVALMA